MKSVKICERQGIDTYRKIWVNKYRNKKKCNRFFFALPSATPGHRHAITRIYIMDDL